MAAVSIITPRAFDAVVWDYDGTLVDTRSGDEAAVAALVAADPTLTPGVQVFWETEGRPITERLELAWPERAGEILGLFDQYDIPKVHAGVRRVLTSLHRARVGQAVVSSRRLEPLCRGLGQTRLATLFAAVVGLESVAVCKPDPEGLHRALAALGVAPSRAVFVGDRDVDMEAARRAGMTGWLATWGYPSALHPSAAAILAHPDEVVLRVHGPQAAAG